MPNVYSWRFHVRTYETDSAFQVSLPIYLNYLEEGATQASSSLGYTYDWYWQNKRMWVVRKLTIRFYEPAVYGDELQLFTWISDVRRVQSNREYDLRRAEDEQPILRARANWVFVNSETMQPTRLPQEVVDTFDPAGEVDEIDSQVSDPITIEDPVIHTEERRVQHHELDSLGHVNNAVYLLWCEQALINLMRTAGWPPERFASDGVAMRPLANEIEYFRSALDDEPIWIVSRLAEIGLDRASWHHEIRHGATGELIARNIAVRAFADANGPRSIPDALQISLTQRSKLQ
jgi:acyl-CoA thioester hydrolase